jgi:hypothetical protein
LFVALRQSAGEDAVDTLESMVRDAPDHALNKMNALDLAADAIRDFLEDDIIGLAWFLDPKNRDEAIKNTSEFTKSPPCRPWLPGRGEAPAWSPATFNRARRNDERSSLSQPWITQET